MLDVVIKIDYVFNAINYSRCGNLITSAVSGSTGNLLLTDTLTGFTPQTGNFSAEVISNKIVIKILNDTGITANIRWSYNIYPTRG
jgi:hypothetical protein